MEIQYSHSHEWITSRITCNHSVLPEDEQVDSENKEGKSRDHLSF